MGATENKKFTAQTNLCTCNNCGTIMEDENPQIGAKKFLVNVNKVPKMKQIKEDGGRFWACPVCETDFFLTDEVDETVVKEREIM